MTHRDHLRFHADRSAAEWPLLSVTSNKSNCFSPKRWWIIDFFVFYLKNRQFLLGADGIKRPFSERSVCLPLSLYCQIDGCIWKHLLNSDFSFCRLFVSKCFSPQRNDFLHKTRRYASKSWRIFFHLNLRWVSIFVEFQWLTELMAGCVFDISNLPIFHELWFSLIRVLMWT